MSELDPEAQALLDAEREAPAATPADRERVRHLLAASLGSAALDLPAPNTTPGDASAGAGGGSTTLAPGGAGLLTSTGAKLLAGAALAGIVALGVMTLPGGERERAHEQAAPPSPPPAVEAPAPARAAPPEATSVPAVPTVPVPNQAAKPSDSGQRASQAATAEPSAPGDTAGSPLAAPRSERTSTKGHPAPTSEPPRPLVMDRTDGPTLQAELAALGAAQGALREGDPEGALVYLDRHAERYPNGALKQERMAARAVALCMLGRDAEGRAEQRALAAEAPSSPLLGRVRSACRNE